MFYMDVADYRKFSDYEILISEQDFADALIEAGVKFDRPFGLRVRVKDLDQRMIIAKADIVDPKGDEYRVNLYLPPDPPSAEYLSLLNLDVRHHMVHMAQLRDPEAAARFPSEAMRELQAIMRSKTGKCEVVRMP